MRVPTILLVCLLSNQATAQPLVEACPFELQNFGSGGIFIHYHEGEVRHVRAYHEHSLGRLEVSVTPLASGSAVMNFDLFEYWQRPDDVDGPLVIERVAIGRSLVSEGEICEADACFYGQEGISRISAQQYYDEFQIAFETREGCFVQK